MEEGTHNGYLNADEASYFREEDGGSDTCDFRRTPSAESPKAGLSKDQKSMYNNTHYRVLFTSLEVLLPL